MTREKSSSALGTEEEEEKKHKCRNFVTSDDQEEEEKTVICLSIQFLETSQNPAKRAFPRAFKKIEIFVELEIKLIGEGQMYSDLWSHGTDRPRPESVK